MMTVMTGNMMTRAMRAMMTTTATSRKGAHFISSKTFCHKKWAN